MDFKISKEDDDATLDIGMISDGDDMEIISKKKPKVKKLGKSKKFKKVDFGFKPKPKVSGPTNPVPGSSYANSDFSSFRDTTFESLSNPQKKKTNDDMSDDDDESDAGGMSIANDGGDSEASDEPPAGGYSAEEVRDEADIGPSSGFQNIEDEKQDLLYKFYRLDQKGIKCKKFNMYSDIREMRSEYNKLKRDAEISSGVKFSKKMLMAIVSGMEFMNKRYDPFGMELNGWSENVMENMTDGDFDNVLERLQEKYHGKVNTPPEMELMMSLAGSACMFHMTSSMFKASGPSINDFMKNNPSMMQDMLKRASNEAPEQEDKESEGYTMKGPSMNLGGFGGMGAPLNTGNDQSIIMSDDSSPEGSMMSEAISVNTDDIREVSLTSSVTKKRRGRKPKARDQSKGIELDI